VSGICLAGAGVALHILAGAFTLSWTHTIEKTQWIEHWRVEPGRLVLAEAEVQGSGAGMEPPPDARHEGRFYVWNPDETRDSVVLRRDPHAGDWTLCTSARCAPLGAWLAKDADPVTLTPAPADGDCETPPG
jgi:hypothetical protein